MAETEKGNMAVLKEHELLMNAKLISSVPELQEYAEKVRGAFRAKGLQLDDQMSLKTTRSLKPIKGVAIPLPDPGGVCKNGCTAWSGGTGPQQCGVGCTQCVGTCRGCVSWVGGQKPNKCGVCTSCIHWT
jgi:hypothetical protein